MSLLRRNTRTRPSRQLRLEVDAAKPGDTIDVAPGTYHENVVIGKTLSLLGAHAGVNPITGLRTNPAKESTVNGSIAVQSTANVRVDGFSLNDPESLNDPDRVPLVDAFSQRDTITNNIVLPGAQQGVELIEGDLTTLSNNKIESAVLFGIN